MTLSHSTHTHISANKKEKEMKQIIFLYISVVVFLSYRIKGTSSNHGSQNKSQTISQISKILFIHFVFLYHINITIFV